jgi:XTP/dITP diphosphohydrolase
MQRVVLATSNEGKVREIRAIAAEVRADARGGAPELSLLGLSEFPRVRMPEEVGETFVDNALLKGVAVCVQTGLPALADDSGLMVAALGGRPGVRSARFAGEDATDDDNMRLLLRELQRVPLDRREGAFVCAAALVLPAQSDLGTELLALVKPEEVSQHTIALSDGTELLAFSCEGRVNGVIGTERRGEGGFGYDPLFIYPPLELTFAELTAARKSELSHRGRAFGALLRWMLWPATPVLEPA